MGGSSSRKGDRREREFVNWLADNGWGVIRVPTSGGGTERDLPDLLAGRDGRSLAIEVKSSGGDPIYIDSREVDGLNRFASKFGADARIATKFDLEHGDPAYGEDRPGFRVHAPGELYVTPGGNYRLKKSTAIEIGTREVDL